MQVPSDDEVRATVRRFIADNANLGIRVLVLTFKGIIDSIISQLIQQGATQEEINQRVDRSNKFFDEETSQRYLYQPFNSFISLQSNIGFQGPRLTPDEKRARIISRREKLKLENEKSISELGVKTLSQNDIIQIITQRRATFQIPKSPKMKVLLVCVSYDEDHIRQNCIDIVRYLGPSVSEFGQGEIEFFCVNPETYGPARGNRQIWIDREHYFQMPFGDTINPNQQTDYDRLIQNGPYDVIIYAHCPIFSIFSTGGVGRDITIEGQELNAIMRPDSSLVVYPFDNVPVGATLSFKSIGIDLIGKTDFTMRRTAATVPTIGIYMKRI